MEDDDLDQRITFLLQEIDGNLSAAHQAATQVFSSVRRHHQVLRQIHSATQIWQPLFDACRGRQPPLRRPTMTPSKYPHRTSAVHVNSNAVEDATPDDLDGTSFVPNADGFKTTKLRTSVNQSNSESANSSAESAKLPKTMTPILPKSPAGRRARQQQNESSTSNILHHNWGSFLRTDVIDAQAATHTVGSEISSVEQASPGVNVNLSEVGAFELTPHDKSRRAGSQPVASNADTSKSPNRQSMSPRVRMDGSHRKRQRRLSDDPSTPKKRHTMGRTASPNLRRKYGAAQQATPPRFHKARMSAPEQNSTSTDANVEMTSPLLRTTLKGMGRNTPLSNRIAGATYDAGSASQESRLQEYDSSFSTGMPPPEFTLSQFPPSFQQGKSAVALSTLYSKFQGNDDASRPALSVPELIESMPDEGEEKIEIMLDLLVSRRFLRAFTVEGRMYWQASV